MTVLDRIDFDKIVEVFEATGYVVILGLYSTEALDELQGAMES